MIKDAINKLVNGNNLTESEAADTMTEIMSGEATEAQIASFITALRIKGETIEEITGCARIMRKFATPIRLRTRIDVDRDDIGIDAETILDTCGTGGDGTCTFNVSTATAFVVAACGLTVAKHGNRSVSSTCGSADVLEALGVNLNVTPEKVETCIEKTGIGFLFAPSLHGAMKYAIGPRRQIGIRTIFNVLGPLTNPAGATAQVLGVYSARLVEMLAYVLRNLGTKRAWVVHGEDGMDEITITGPTTIADLNNDEINLFTITPEQFGLKSASLAELKGGDAKQNAGVIEEIFEGHKGPRRDIVLLNASAGLVVGGKARDMKEGITLASGAIDSGKAKQKLAELIAFTTAL
ncbi:MAG: anthranilate phosphoribosyltransferase [Elusimicrobia bacterium RIFOXYA2_FULL_50_26]|nr:MAG: anthranilate phosphoribosyltransferase [Elusimicrobia bacterium RIFOXYA2_FULL_50_26]